MGYKNVLSMSLNKIDYFYLLIPMPDKKRLVEG